MDELSLTRSVRGAASERQTVNVLQPGGGQYSPDLPLTRAAPALQSSSGGVVAESTAAAATLNRASGAMVPPSGRPPIKVGSIKCNPFILADIA
eukprot:CAMPEP_0172894236 /NCGR_PEP_ID=MMETSP1075-20121228/150438_1 /TAXON_ID=2916 /ORGANISM="Ceratium fusus, Strain PA161109" /LENGTH=93 /DNA_ID=CAMNT_0013749227 /DNA_START=745 /DNA_END=1022 /DNA_ORIENTATION=+